jgi:hypothetical protein
MASPKYQKFYSIMRERNKPLFDQFAQVHAGYAADSAAWQSQFHSVGRDVLDVIRDWEGRLCSGTERSGYGQYSSKLAEKFWSLIKHDYPLIDQVGIIKTTL